MLNAGARYGQWHCTMGTCHPTPGSPHAGPPGTPVQAPQEQYGATLKKMQPAPLCTHLRDRVKLLLISQPTKMGWALSCLGMAHFCKRRHWESRFCSSCTHADSDIVHGAVCHTGAAVSSDQTAKLHKTLYPAATFLASSVGFALCMECSLMQHGAACILSSYTDCDAWPGLHRDCASVLSGLPIIVAPCCHRNHAQEPVH